MKQNYILVDFENLQPNSLEKLYSIDCKVIVFVGQNQSKLSTELAISIQNMGERAKYVQIVGDGKNALDFHIAYYIGKINAEDNSAYFHIMSKDRGFDPLIRYIRKNGGFAIRSESIDDIPLLKISNAETLKEKVGLIVSFLKERGTGRPRKVQTLKNAINSRFQKELNESELEKIVDELKKIKVIKVDETKVSYEL